MQELIPPHKRTVELTFKIFIVNTSPLYILTSSKIYDIIYCNIKHRNKGVQMTKYDYILWDWNGTIVDDLNINFKIINQLILD